MSKEVSYSFDFMNWDTVATHVVVYTDGTVDFENFTDDIFDRAFGMAEVGAVDFLDVYKFFASRCMPPNRGNVNEVLAGMGLKHYDPLRIVEKTYGVTLSNPNWVRFEGVTKTYDEVFREVYGMTRKEMMGE